MELVLDASVAIAFVIGEEHSARAEKLLSGITAKSSLWIPSLWWHEVADAVVMARRRGRITEAQGARALELLNDFPLQVESPPGAVAAARLAQTAHVHGLSVYDAAYLELAERRGIPLATYDRALLMAARAAGVKTL